ncbi:MAG: hypothetical protein IPP29_21075 [Bacteroidetes bacterium]|nr:hypothetical protein [Bacteroidota bacterium]
MKLLPGYNYLWLTYDIKPTAFVGHIVDAQFEGVKTN